MPSENTFKLEGKKLVPANRFNLTASNPSSSFSAVKPNTSNFSVIRHPVVNSISIDPIININVEIAEHFPLIENELDINENSSFKDYADDKSSLIFPKVEILPDNNTVFYYEEVLDKDGKPSGSYFGRVTLKYNISKLQLQENQYYVDINISEAILNLKITGNEPIRINGNIDKVNKSITFNLINESVKVAFSNLITEIVELRSSIDLYFEFKGYYKLRTELVFAEDMLALNRSNFMQREAKSDNVLQKMTVLNRPLILKSSASKTVISNEFINGLQKDNKIKPKIQENHIKSTLLLKMTKSLHYPLSNNVSTSLYKTLGGGFTNIPFNHNNDFSQFKQIFVPGANFNKLSIYKSTIQPDTFLLIPKLYCLCRAADTMSPCITTIFHFAEEGSSLSEDISKISFNFALGPYLSDYDLAKLKLDLFNNNFLDNKNGDFITSIKFLYPDNIDAEYLISGNSLLKQSDLTIDGKYFIFTLNIENLNDASLIINALNNSLSQYANINFIHKEIKDTSIIDLNIEKTIGEVLHISEETNNKLTIENKSISKCKIHSALTINQNFETYFNSAIFDKFPPLKSSQSKVLDLASINPKSKGSPFKYIYLNYESIEDISAEFKQIIAQSTDYERFITIQIQKQKPNVNKIQLELFVLATGNKFTIEKSKSEFKIPILFNFLIKNSVVTVTKVSYNVKYFDINGNIICNKADELDYSKTTMLKIAALK